MIRLGLVYGYHIGWCSLADATFDHLVSCRLWRRTEMAVTGSQPWALATACIKILRQTPWASAKKWNDIFWVQPIFVDPMIFPMIVFKVLTAPEVPPAATLAATKGWAPKNKLLQVVRPKKNGVSMHPHSHGLPFFLQVSTIGWSMVDGSLGSLGFSHCWTWPQGTGLGMIQKSRRYG